MDPALVMHASKLAVLLSDSYHDGTGSDGVLAQADAHALKEESKAISVHQILDSCMRETLI